MTFALLRIRQRKRERRFSARRLCDPAKHEFARSYIDPRTLVTRIEPDLCHDVVGGIVAPPRAMMLRLRRQFHTGDRFDLVECQRHLVRGLLTQKRSKGLILSHDYLRDTHTVSH